MAQSKEGTQATDAADSLDLSGVTKLVAVLAALAYGTGVVAINTYLHGLGIADFSFAKPKLLLTGTLVLSTFLLSASFPFFFEWVKAARSSKDNVSTAKQASSWGLPLLGLLYFIGLLFAAYLLCFRLDSPVGQLRGWWIWQYLGPQSKSKQFLALALIVVGVYGPACAGSVLAIKAKRYFLLANWQRGGFRTPVECFHFTVTVAAALVFFIGYIMIFTFVFYPSIPVEFGGGEAYFESFGIADGLGCELQQAGIPFDQQRPGLTKPLPVLHETDTMIAVWLQRDPSESKKYHKAVSDDREDPSGFSDNDFVVVQLGKGAIVSMRAYPRWKRVPTLVQSPTPCGVGPAQK